MLPPVNLTVTPREMKRRGSADSRLVSVFYRVKIHSGEENNEV
jgi:hypothetical protein